MIGGANAAATLSTARVRAAVLIGALVMVMEGYDLVVFGATTGAVLRYEPWGLDVGALGLIASLTPLGMLFGALAVGSTADRVGRRRTTLGCLIIVTVGMLACALSTSVAMFGAGRLIVGIGVGAVFPAMAPLIFEIAPAHRRTLYSAIVLAGISVGGVVAAWCANTVVVDHGFRSAYLVGVLLGALLIPVTLLGLPESPELLAARTTEAADASTRSGLRAVLRSGRAGQTIAFATATICSFLLIFGMNTWLPQLMALSGQSAGASITFLLLLNAGATVGGLLMATLADRIGQRTPVIACFAIGACGVALLALHPATWLAWAIVFVAGAGVLGVQAVLNVFVAASYPVELRGAAIGLVLGVGRIGAIAGPTVGGWLLALELDPRWNFLLFAVPAAVGVAVIASLRLRPTDTAAPHRSRRALNQAQTITYG